MSAERKEKMVDSGAQQPDSEEYGLQPVLTVDEAAEFLRVNPKTLYSLINEGKLPFARKVGRTTRILRSALLQWLRGEGRVPPTRRKR
ncbi:helix-turn-helix domain-containing protein [Myxococcota bacterium]